MVTELPLVLFTLLTQMAVGLAIVTATGLIALTADGEGAAIAVGPKPGSRLSVIWMAVLGLLVVGVIAAFFHLGRPLGFVRMFTGVGTTWLSREVLSLALFGVVTALTWWLAYRNRPTAQGVALLAALVGVVAVFSTGMTYAAPGLPAISNGLPLVFFFLSALILGPAVGSYFTPADKQGLLCTILSYSLVVALVVYLIVPSIWLSSGSGVAAMTGRAFLASPLYWLRIVLGLALPLAVMWRTRRIPAWLPLLLILGELVGRIIFFTLVFSEAVTIGG